MRRFIILLLAVVMVFSLAVYANNKPENYPRKAIQLIVPAGPGSAADVPARTLVEILDLGQPVVVVNRPGASTTVGSAEAATKPADGYTILWCAPGGFLIQPHILDLTYEVDDFRHIALTAPPEPEIIMVPNESPIQSFQDLEKRLKSGERIIFSGANPGSVGHLAMAALNKEMEAENAEFVPFNGSAEGIAALLGGHIDLFVVSAAEVIPRVKNGQVRALAVFNSERLSALPDVPSVEEFGYTDMTFAGMKWLAMHKDTPNEIVEYIKQQVNIATQTKEYQDFMYSINGLDMNVLSEEELTKMVVENNKKFGRVINMLGMAKN